MSKNRACCAVCALAEGEELIHHRHGHGCEEPACCDGDGRGHSHEHDDHDHGNIKGELPLILLGAAAFFAGILTRSAEAGWVPLALFLAAYAILGFGVLREAVSNLFGGTVFDENFLMSVATIGAFVIGEYPEAVAVMLFYRVGEWFEHRAVLRSRKAIRDAIDLRPESVLKLVDGKTEKVPPEEVFEGDLLLVRPGDRIALDGVVVFGSGSVDTSAVTGEPLPVDVSEGDSLISGCINLNGSITMRVTAPLSESTATRILLAVEHAQKNKPKIDKFIKKFAKIYTPAVCALALLVAVLPPALGLGAWKDWIYRALLFLVASCPCAIVLSVPLTYFAGLGAGGKKGILFKGGSTLEGLCGIKAVVLDKTGTLTKGVPAVGRVVASDPAETLRIAADAERHSTHPISAALRNAAKEKALPASEPKSVTELAGKGIVAQLEEGEAVVGSVALLKERGIAVPQDAPGVLVALNGKFLGSITIEDELKSGASQAVSRLKSMGMTVHLFSGDAEDNVRKVAAQTGVDSAESRLFPDEKLRLMEALRKKAGPVLFVGDGINDAPVLAGADVGGAMGSGADVAIQAADVVYMTGAVDAILASIFLARRTRRIAVQNVAAALAVKAAVLILGLLGIASLWWAVFADVGMALLCTLNALLASRDE
jgi:Cd2+/Zn2+-exporting ATPase